MIFIIALLAMLLFYACIEPFEIQASTSFESRLVVEATITDEEKLQGIRISRTYNLDQEESNPESNAQVGVIDDLQNEFTFQETEAGLYVSTSAFAVQPGRGYRLQITTSDGRSYSTKTETTPVAAEITNVYANRETNDFGADGMAVYIDIQGDENSSRYFRFEYEETYKIVAPFYSPSDAIVVRAESPIFEYGLRERESRQSCYGNRFSNRIVLANTDGQEANGLDAFQVKFIPNDDFAISHRYSILVKQYSQSPSAYAYYERLRDFAQSENPFSENQPGFLEGNVFSENNPDEKVIGFFEVVSTSSKRLFFNYRDFYPEEPLPPYPMGCGISEPESQCGPLAASGCIPHMVYIIEEGDLVFYELREPEGSTKGQIEFGLFRMVPFDCGDCSRLGDIEAPEFWIE